MGLVKDQIKEQLKLRIKESLAKKRQQEVPPKKTVGGFVKNVGTDVTNLTKGLVGLGYQAITHPIESAKTVGSAALETAKRIPRAATELSQTAGRIITQPKDVIDSFVKDYKTLRSIPMSEQKRFFGAVTEQQIKQQEKGKMALGVLGSGLLSSFVQEISHPAQYFYENPVSASLDILSAGQATGANKLASSVLGRAADSIPAVSKIKSAIREVFVPNGKLINAGFPDVAGDLTNLKSKVFSAQRKIIDETATKFNKEFRLTPIEQREFFKTIDSLRRSGEKAASVNPKIQKAITWWLDEQAPELRKMSGLSEEGSITNYMHHFFPDKFKGKDVNVSAPVKLSNRGYLKESKDVAGFTEDPVLSISAIKSKVAIDNLRDSFITKTVNKYGNNLDNIKSQLTSQLGEFEVNRLDQTGKLPEYISKNLGLEEYRPSSLRNPSSSELGQQTYFLPKAIVEELNKVTNPSTGVLEKLFLPFDVFNRNWKPLATATRLRYHTRNIVGNIYNGMVLGGFDLRDAGVATLAQVKGQIAKTIDSGNLLGKFYKKVLGDVPEPQIIKTAIDNDVIGRGFFSADLNDLITASENGANIMKTIKNINSPAEIYRVPVLREWLSTSQKVGEFLEDNARLALFNKAMRKFGGDVAQSKAYVNKYLFDYLTGLGEGDRVIKRFIPFWSWTRFNIPLQLEALGAQPIKQAAIKAFSKPTAEVSELTDPGYKYLSEDEKNQGYFKVGEVKTGNKILDKYIRTSGVIPQQDLVRIVNILQGKEEDIGFTPLKDIYKLITSDPTKVNDYFGRPIERFPGEQKKFLGTSVSGRVKELASTIPLLTELNKLFGGSLNKENLPDIRIRGEQVTSPVGVTLIDRENNKFFSDLEKQKELDGSYTAGLVSIYKRYLINDMKSENSESYNIKNIDILEQLLLSKGLSKLDILKIKNAAIKSALKEKIDEAIRRAGRKK